MRDDDATRRDVPATATHDGCFRLQVPLGAGDTHVGILFGDRYRWLQLLEARVLRVGDLHLDADPDAGIDVRAHLLLDGIVDHGDGLLHCHREQALAMVPAGLVTGADRLALDLVFRPLAAHAAADAAQAAQAAG